MKKSIIFIIIGILIFSVTIVGTIWYLNKDNTAKTKIQSEQELAVEDYEDECTEEYEELEQTLQTNSNNILVSPNAQIVIYTHYRACNHDKKTIEDVPKEIVNMNENEVRKYYKDYEIKDFSQHYIELYKEDEGICDEHYVIREKNGVLIVYKQDENKKEDIYEETEISYQYLTDTDKITISNGLEVVGKENLNKIIEDFE